MKINTQEEFTVSVGDTKLILMAVFGVEGNKRIRE